MKAQCDLIEPLGLAELLEREITPIVLRGASSVSPDVWQRVLTGLAREILARPGKKFRGQLVRHCYHLAGGTPGSLRHQVPLLVELLHCGSLIVDDIQDDSPTRRGGPSLHKVCGMPLALNTGNWLYFAAFELISHLGVPSTTAAIIYQLLSTTLFRCHQGQALDLAIDVATVRQREVAAMADASAALKTGLLVAFAAELGAVIADAPAKIRYALAAFGSALGVGLQNLDDYGGIVCEQRAAKGIEDLACARLTWVWAYLAKTINEVRFAGLQAHLRHARAARGGERRALLVSLRSELGDLVEGKAKASIRARLAHAQVKLREALPAGAAEGLAAIAAEVRRLEESYG